METNTLLEHGTGEQEILEFLIDGKSYGINVDKVREIIPDQKVTPIPNSHSSIEGIFMPRDTMLAVVNLPRYLHLNEENPSSSLGDMMIITKFNHHNIAFRVHSVMGIHRISRSDIIEPDEGADKAIYSESLDFAIGMIQINEQAIAILDFEKIIADINPSDY